MSRKTEYLAHFNPQELPEQYRKLTDIIGFESTLDLIECYNGDTVHIPKLDELDRQLRNKKMYADYLKGSTANELAEKYNLSSVQVYQIVHKALKKGVKTQH